MNSTLRNKRVLVTGAAQRIGRSIVLEFAKAGAKLVIHHDKSQREAKVLLKEIGGENPATRLSPVISGNLPTRESS